MRRASLFKKLEYWNINIINAFFLAIIIVITIQIGSRSFFHNAFAWAEEVSRYLFIYMVLGGAALSYKQNMWVSVDLISKHLSHKAKHIYDIAIEIIAFLFFSIISVISIIYLKSSKGQLTAALQIGMAYAYAALPIFFIQMSIISISKIAAAFKGEDN